MEVELLQQIHGENNRPVEGNQHNGVVIAVFQHDFPCHLGDGLVNFIGVDVFDKRLVQKGHCITHFLKIWRCKDTIFWFMAYGLLMDEND